jgi:hypothetical protein
MDRKKVLAVLAVVLIVLAGAGYYSTTGKKSSVPGKKLAAPPMPPGIIWNDVYQFGKQGYEPGLVVDSLGYMYYTAHKNMDDKTSWQYLASWFFVGSPDGKTWMSPDNPTIRGEKWKTEAGDEGDIAIDANDRVYYVDTYLVDNHLHVFDSPGVWQYSVRVQKTTGLDDRPWIAAQGNKICHYLGNNAMVVNGGRYWYYRSTDGGRIWSRATPVPGNGWAHIDAETKGTHAYIISEGDVDVPADMLVYRSDDSGQSWNFNDPIIVGHRDGPGSVPGVAANGENVWISAGTNGAVWCLWSETDGVQTHNHMFLGWSFDYGRTWNSSDITPWDGYFLYPALDVGDDGTVAVAFYATESVPVTDQSEWYIYGGMIRPDSPFHPANPGFEAQSNATRTALLAEAKHSVNATNLTNLNSTLFFNFTKGEQAPCTTGSNLHDLHDFFEIAVGPDGYLDIAYQHYIGPANGHSDLYFVRGTLGGANSTAAVRR